MLLVSKGRGGLEITGPMAHKNTMWAVGDVAFEMLTDLTDDPVVTLLVSTPAGELAFTAEPALRGRTLILRRTHVQGARPGAVGGHNLAVIAQAVMRGMDVDELIVEGALRTTGARPGHRPRPFRYTSHVHAAPSTEQ
jgi:hypothetical protein